MNVETVSVIGLGYIGLPTAAVFAAHKIKVIGVDVDFATVEMINRGGVHIIEPDLEMLVHAVVTQGYLHASTQPEPADAFIIAVPTPFKDDHEPDLSYIEAASKSIAKFLKRGDLVILESTSPVGATEKMSAWLAEIRSDLTFPQTHGDASDIRIAHCPERVLPGDILRELVQNDRVIGGMTGRCSEVAHNLYKIFVKGECFLTNVRTAEMCKLAENSYRDVNIAFANELAVVCDKLDVDVWELIRLANRHPRVNILKPGPGVGGHCIAVDPWFIVSQVPEQAKLIRVAREVNDNKPAWVIEKLQAAIGDCGRKNGKNESELSIACFGLAFKADIDDLRESPALSITLELASRYPGQVMAVEPHIAFAPPSLIQAGVPLVDFTSAITADVLLFLVGHAEFYSANIKVSNAQVVLDACGVFE